MASQQARVSPRPLPGKDPATPRPKTARRAVDVESPASQGPGRLEGLLDPAFAWALVLPGLVALDVPRMDQTIKHWRQTQA